MFMIPALSCHWVTMNDGNISCSKDTNVHAQFDSSWLHYQKWCLIRALVETLFFRSTWRYHLNTMYAIGMVLKLLVRQTKKWFVWKIIITMKILPVLLLTGSLPYLCSLTIYKISVVIKTLNMKRYVWTITYICIY